MKSKKRTGNVRTAVFGGTFDPPHRGHIGIAEAVTAGNFAGKIIFTPAYHPPHKPAAPVTPFRHRMKMTLLAAGKNPAFSVSDIERRRPAKPSYTIDTLSELSKEFPGETIILLIGSDSLRQLHTWHRGGEIAEKWPILTFPRKNEIPDIGKLRKNWSGELAEKLFKSILPLKLFDFSSTEIRRRLRRGKDVSAMLAPEVHEYILKNKLYGS